MKSPVNQGRKIPAAEPRLVRFVSNTSCCHLQDQLMYHNVNAIRVQFNLNRPYFKIWKYFRLQVSTRMWNCMENNFVWKHNRCFSWWKTCKYPDNYVKKFWEVYWKLRRDDFYLINPNTKFVLFFTPGKRNEHVKEKIFIFL